jgi:hypothetical protein
MTRSSIAGAATGSRVNVLATSWSSESGHVAWRYTRSSIVSKVENAGLEFGPSPHSRNLPRSL